YAGEAAGYIISDPTERALIASGTIPADQIPLIVQDRTFVPDEAQLALQDPTWDSARWGTKGSFWYHHVYMPAQNPGDPSGMSAYGRWMYGPWFWPPAADTVYGPIDNPYYDPNCKIDEPATWQYDTDPFCEPEKIPGTPNVSAGMEQFNDTPIVNGVAYPKVTLEPKAYRLRVLNAANDRFFNFQWYVADPTQGDGLTEVALKAAELEAAQTDPNVFPTPDTTVSLPGPDWIQIGTEGGFLPAPVVIDGQQPTTWITDPTRFDVGNVDQHSLLLAPAERADVIVDFSKFAGKTLILYNDAPAAFPARVASYDYYTGAPDLSPVGAPTILPGYGPNTRTIMQVTIAGTAAPTFNLSKLRTAFRHNASGTGVFESGQHPITVGQAAYNSAYGTSFAASSNCNAPGSTVQRCDGYVRVNDTMTFGFNTLRAPNVKLTLPIQPKAIHDETNASTFDEYGRMTANLGVEAQPPTPGQQNVTLYPFVNPGTELIDGTNLPKNHVFYDTNGLPVSDIKVTPIGSASDGTQIWRITHNGVDTHPIHFHLYDVQLINRVTWDNIIIPPDPNELGWKDTVRVAPLEDTIFAIRPIVPEVPWELPNAIRMQNPMMPEGSQAMFHNFDPQGNPTSPIVNQLVNFGWEYVYHCHILSHEEMDMMRPVSLVLPPIKPDRLEYTTNGSNLTLTWWDNSITETAFLVQRTTSASGWQTLATIASPLDQPNVHEQRSYTDTNFNSSAAYQYRVVALNKVGYGGAFPSVTAQSMSDAIAVGTPLPPVVVSSTRQDPNPTNLSTVNFLVTFSEPVTGVDTADFALNVTGGITGHSITSVNPTDGTGATYTVAVNTGSGDGTIRLDVVDDNSILNGFSVALGGPTAGDGNYNTGEKYDIDKTQPTASSIIRSSPNPSNAATVWFSVTFSEPVTGVSTADFGLNVTGSIINASVASVTGTGTTRSVAVNAGTGSGTLSLELPATATITDLVGNPLTSLPFSTAGQEYIIYQTAPTVVSSVRASASPTNATSVDYTVTFSEAVTGVDATDFLITTTGNVTGTSVTGVNDPSGTGIAYTVTVNTGSGSGTLRLDLIDNNSIKNIATVPLGGTGTQNYITGEVYTLDKTSPTVVAITRASPNPTNAASVNFTVTFTEAVTGVDTTDFAATTASGTITGSSVTSVNQPDPNQPVYTVVVNPGTGTGTLRLDLMDDNTIIDAVGNPLGGAGTNNYIIGQFYNFDNTPPTVVSIVRASPNPTNAGSADYTVTFSEPVLNVDTADFALNLTGTTSASVSSVTGTSDTRTVTVTTASGDGTLRLDLMDNDTITDALGNPLGGAGVNNYTSGEVYDVDNTAPTVVSVVRTSANPVGTNVNYTVTFSEAVTGVDTADFAVTTTGNITGHSVTGVSGSGTSYTVVVNTGTGAGTLRLDVPGTATITDLATNALASLPFTSGASSQIMDLGKYDDVNAAWAYNNFIATTSTGPYAGTFHYSNTVGSQAEFVFNGSQLVVTYSKYSNRGNLDVYIDNVLVGTINQYNATRVWQATWTSGNLGLGQHTLKLVHASGSTVDIDALDVKTYQILTTGKYDDVHASLTYNNFIATTSTGPYAGTLHYSNTVGSQVEFTFTGSQLVVLYSKFNNRGNIDVYIDNLPAGTINQYNSTRLWQSIWRSGDLGPGEHTARLVHASGSTVDIDAIEVKTYQVLTPNTYDDVHAGLTYGNFTATTSTGPYAGTFHYSTTVGSQAEFTFTGSQITLMYSKFSNRGNLAVYVDGVLAGTINEYNATRVWQSTWTSGNLGAGQHTVTLVHASGSSVDIDAVQILP
ncbi:MAG TPA: multicopper oxidase domain-containing protein, partial [Anaerolineales bacterium]|nr:multicopper oxidase domain-containing protein [Anaerolineales bacterium]